MHWSFQSAHLDGHSCNIRRTSSCSLECISTLNLQAALTEAATVCAACPISAECADLAELSGYTGIAAGQGYRNGRIDRARQRQPRQRRTAWPPLQTAPRPGSVDHGRASGRPW